MVHKRFREWFSHVDELTAAQCKEVAAVLSDPPEGAGTGSTGPLWQECARARHRMLPERRFGGCRCNIQALMDILARDQASCSRLAGGRPSDGTRPTQHTLCT